MGMDVRSELAAISLRFLGHAVARQVPSIADQQELLNALVTAYAMPGADVRDAALSSVKGVRDGSPGVGG